MSYLPCYNVSPNHWFYGRGEEAPVEISYCRIVRLNR